MPFKRIFIREATLSHFRGEDAVLKEDRSDCKVRRTAADEGGGSVLTRWGESLMARIRRMRNRKSADTLCDQKSSNL